MSTLFLALGLLLQNYAIVISKETCMYMYVFVLKYSKLAENPKYLNLTR
jgi:hypothetical protein